jgi:hypothetical protein
MIRNLFRSFSRQDSLPRHLEELPEDPFPPLPPPAPLVPPLDLRGSTNKRLQQQQQLHQQQQQQQQLQSINTRAFSKDPHYEEQHGKRRHPDPQRVGGRRNPAFAPDAGGSPVTYYPKIKDSLSLARARLDVDLADDVSGGAETTFVGGAYVQWPEVGGAGIQGLQELLLHQGGAVRPLPRPRDSIEIYQEHYLQVRTAENKDDI